MRLRSGLASRGPILWAVLDTERMAQQAQVAAARKLGPEGRLRVAIDMSEDARRISIEGVRRRHPEYTEEEARRFVLRLLYGEELVSRAWPGP
jgi:hypothetical protein